MIKIEKNLDLWLAADKLNQVGFNKTGLKTVTYIFHKKPTISKFPDESTQILFEVSDDSGSYDRIFSAESLKLENDYKPHKLYILKTKHKESIRTFWLSILGYRKYVLTNHYPIKEREFKQSSVPTSIYGATSLYINNYECASTWFDNVETSKCTTCSKFEYCKQINDKNYLINRKVYLYYIKNNKKTYL